MQLKSIVAWVQFKHWNSGMLAFPPYFHHVALLIMSCYRALKLLFVADGVRRVQQVKSFAARCLLSPTMTGQADEPR